MSTYVVFIYRHIFRYLDILCPLGWQSQIERFLNEEYLDYIHITCSHVRIQKYTELLLAKKHMDVTGH
jgi:hypothetical protein